MKPKCWMATSLSLSFFAIVGCGNQVTANSMYGHWGCGGTHYVFQRDGQSLIPVDGDPNGDTWNKRASMVNLNTWELDGKTLTIHTTGFLITLSPQDYRMMGTLLLSGAKQVDGATVQVSGNDITQVFHVGGSSDHMTLQLTKDVVGTEDKTAQLGPALLAVQSCERESST